MFACAVVGMQCSALAKIYNAFIHNLHNNQDLETYHLIYDINNDQNTKDSKDRSTLAGHGIGSCKQKAGKVNWISFIFLTSQILTLDSYHRQTGYWKGQVAHGIAFSSSMLVSFLFRRKR